MTGAFSDCRLSDIAEYLHHYAAFCVLTPAETDGKLKSGLRMRVRPLPLLEAVQNEAPMSPECDYTYDSMTAGARQILAGNKGLRQKAFARCRDALEKFMVLAKYERFQSCVQEVDQKRNKK